MAPGSPALRAWLRFGPRTGARSLVGTVCAAAALGLGGMSAPAVLAVTRTCSQIHGTRVKATGRATVIVQSVNEEQVDGQRARIAYVCASPNGRAWRAGEAVTSDAGSPYRVRVVASAGYWVALRFESVIGEGESVEERAIDATTGKSVHYWSAGGGMGTGSGGAIERVLLDSHGRLAFALGINAPIQSGFGTEGEGEQLLTREIVGVGSTGKRKVLDSAPHARIPPQSLTLVGGTVHWTDAGVARSAKL